MIPCNIISLAYKALQVHASKLVQMIGVLSFPKMNNYTHTHTHTPSSLSIHPSTGTWVVSMSWLL